MISPTASPPRHRAPAVKRFKLVDLSGDLQPSVHRPLRTDGTPISKGIKALQSMLNLPEAAARAVRLFDSKEAEVQVHAADTLGNPGLIEDDYEIDADGTLTLYYKAPGAASQSSSGRNIKLPRRLREDEDEDEGEGEEHNEGAQGACHLAGAKAPVADASSSGGEGEGGEGFEESEDEFESGTDTDEEDEGEEEEEEEEDD
ncbi:MAG: hypothetical protein J3K34DRAFT_521717 [Monoraphidium minutum]|nr:MAG: hypothetical protein J3K34DRAFT_521717 [Monoraphidium minutum]